MRSVPTAALRGARAERSGLVVQLTRIAYRFADAVIANSKAVAADLGRLMHLPDQRVHVIYNPLDIETIERLSQEPPHHPWLDTGTTPLIVSVGSLTALKNFPTLVRAFALVRQRRVCRLAILGEGPERARLEALVREQGLVDDVCLPGFMRNPFAWMRHARVFVSSSLTEGCPNAVMQALACGTPVVSTDVGGSAEILDGGRWGRLVSAEDPCRMAEAVESTLDAPAHPEVRQRAQDFALRPTALQYLRVLLPQVELETAKP
jgi:glycosyltransferase involved in cell wall biosynthesis